MIIKTIKISVLALMLSLTPCAKANIIYDFVCDDVAACGPSLAGSFTIDDLAVNSGSATYSSLAIQVLDFNFSDGFSTWVLGDFAYTSFTLGFSADRSSINNITTVAGVFPDNIIRFENADSNDLYVSVDEVKLYNTDIYAGMWQRRYTVDDPDPSAIPEPSSLTILAVGLIGLSLRRFSKQS